MAVNWENKSVLFFLKHWKSSKAMSILYVSFTSCQIEVVKRNVIKLDQND